MPATMKDVARIAGVSSITVSRVISNPEKVAKPTRQRVLDAIERVGYIPNSIAGSLAARRTRVIGALVPTITNSIFADTIDGLTGILTPRRYKLLLGTSGYSLDTEASLIDAMLAQRPAGIVTTGLQHAPRARERLVATEVPVIETWNIDGEPIDCSVGFSNYRACYKMVEHLADAGYQAIGFVSAPVVANDRAAQRLQGYRDAMAALGLRSGRSLEREAAFSFQARAESLNDLRAGEPNVEVVFFANDILAIGALFECQRRGIRVPEDLAIAGFDDVELAAQVIPALTTVRIPRYRIGQAAAEILLRRIEGESVAPPIVDLGFEIIQRQSTRTRAHKPAQPLRQLVRHP